MFASVKRSLEEAPLTDCTLGKDSDPRENNEKTRHENASCDKNISSSLWCYSWNNNNGWRKSDWGSLMSWRRILGTPIKSHNQKRNGIYCEHSSCL